MATGGGGSVDELRAGLTDMMEQSGSLGRLRARVRAEVFSSLEARDPVHPPLSSANFLINELIRDYFRFNGYSNSLSVFLAESGQPSANELDRAVLRQELGVTEAVTGEARPLIYGIISMLKDWRSRGVAPGGVVGVVGASSNSSGTFLGEHRPFSSSAHMPSEAQYIKEPEPLVFVNTES